jgi:hypothetical protein
MPIKKDEIYTVSTDSKLAGQKGYKRLLGKRVRILQANVGTYASGELASYVKDVDSERGPLYVANEDLLPDARDNSGFALLLKEDRV